MKEIFGKISNDTSKIGTITYTIITVTGVAFIAMLFWVFQPYGI